MALFAVYLFPVTNGKCSGVTRNSRARGQIPSQALHPLTLSSSLPDRVYGAIIDDLFDVLCFGIYVAACFRPQS